MVDKVKARSAVDAWIRATFVDFCLTLETRVPGYARAHKMIDKVKTRSSVATRK
jgi:hypothetical protein